MNYRSLIYAKPLDWRAPRYGHRYASLATSDSWPVHVRRRDPQERELEELAEQCLAVVQPKTRLSVFSVADSSTGHASARSSGHRTSSHSGEAKDSSGVSSFNLPLYSTRTSERKRLSRAEAKFAARLPSDSHSSSPRSSATSSDHRPRLPLPPDPESSSDEGSFAARLPSDSHSSSPRSSATSSDHRPRLPLPPDPESSSDEGSFAARLPSDSHSSSPRSSATSSDHRPRLPLPPDPESSSDEGSFAARLPSDSHSSSPRSSATSSDHRPRLPLPPDPESSSDEGSFAARLPSDSHSSSPRSSATSSDHRPRLPLPPDPESSSDEGSFAARLPSDSHSSSPRSSATSSDHRPRLPLPPDPESSSDEGSFAARLPSDSHSSSPRSSATSSDHRPRLPLPPDPESSSDEGSFAARLPSDSHSSSPRSSATSSDHRPRLPLPPDPEFSSDEDYAVPPDASAELSPVEITEEGDFSLGGAGPCRLERSGYLNVAAGGPEARSKTWKRRWFVARDLELKLYKSKHEEGRSAPLASVLLWEASVRAATVEGGRHGGAALELRWPAGRHLLCADSADSTREWLAALTAGIDSASAAHVQSRLGDPSAWVLSGWLGRVKGGHSRRLHAKLIASTLIFFKSSASKSPQSQLSLRGATVAEVARGSDDSGSDEATPYAKLEERKPQEVSLSVAKDGAEPLYLVLPPGEEKEKWLYHLQMASRDGAFEGTPFEILTQKLMAVAGNPDSELWQDPLLAAAAESLPEPLTTIPASLTKPALELYKSALLFSKVPMQGSALQYHIDLAQGVLAKAVAETGLQEELLCQLIRLTTAKVGGCQSWQLLALAVSLFAPAHYTSLWLLRKHLERWAISTGSGQGRLAFYCQGALARAARMGPRTEGPSRMEALSLFTKDPSTHSLPHSLPIVLPDLAYHIVAFDGSSRVQEVAEELCEVQGLRHPLYSGFALYADHPLLPDSPMPLNPRHKLCDVIARWEREMREGRSGRIPTGKLIRVSLRPRFHWPHLEAGAGEREKLYRAWALAPELRQDRLPVSPELAEHLTALFAQMEHGGLGKTAAIPDETFDAVLGRFYPERLAAVVCKKTLRGKLTTNWARLGSRGGGECASMILTALRRWPVLGSELFGVAMRWRSDEAAWLAVGWDGLRLLSADAGMEELAHHPYSALLQFGGCRGDLQVTLARAVEGGAEEGGATRERLVFALPKHRVLQATLLIADYIKVRRLVCQPPATLKKKRLGTSPRRSPRK